MPASKIKFGTGQHRKTINLLHKMTYDLQIEMLQFWLFLYNRIRCPSKWEWVSKKAQYCKDLYGIQAKWRNGFMLNVKEEYRHFIREIRI